MESAIEKTAEDSLSASEHYLSFIYCKFATDAIAHWLSFKILVLTDSVFIGIIHYFLLFQEQGNPTGVEF